jgi:hypothetical protein
MEERMAHTHVGNNPQAKDQVASRFADIVAYFKRKHPPGRFRRDKDRRAIQWVFSNAYGWFSLRIRWDEQAEHLIVQVPNSRAVPGDKKVAVKALIDLIAWVLASGDFELDLSDGELNFRCKVSMANGSMGKKHIESLCQLAFGCSGLGVPGEPFVRSIRLRVP